MQRVVSELFATVVICLQLGVAQNKSDFSGKWKMDVTRSESAHQDVPIGPVTISIRQTPEEFSIETARTDANSSVVTTDTLTFKLDGKERVNDEPSSVPIKVKAHWDGLKLVTETEREINDSTITTMQVFQLSANGKEITINKSLTVQHGYQSPGVARTTGTGKDVFIKSK